MPPKKRKRKTSGAGSGVGYGGQRNDTTKIQNGIQLAEKRREEHDEKIIHDLLEMKRQLASSLDNNDFDFLTTFFTSKKKSDLEQSLKEVFRNQSPTEWEKKKQCELIYAALGVCDVLANDLQLSSAIFGIAKDEYSLISLLRTLSEQAEMIGAKSIEFDKIGSGAGAEGGIKNGNGGTDDMNTVTYFLQVFEKVRKTMEQVQGLNLGQDSTDAKISARTENSSEVQIMTTTTASSSSSSSSALQTEEYTYKTHLSKLRRLDFIDEWENHYFEQKPRFTGDQRRLYKELISYNQSLPLDFSSSIFVRVLNSRQDLLRALILGPEETPYANGCFFFDIYLPPQYPHVPPKVQFLTTGGGTVRFNPNLYDCGKVCLSLLGTWSGPSWIPNQSTLLQVLLSIQALIFVNDPFFNEPGHERQQNTKKGKEVSYKYNEQLESATITYGIGDPLKSIGKGKAMLFPEFDDVLRCHLSLKRVSINRQLKKYNEKCRQGSTMQLRISKLLSILDCLPSFMPNQECNLKALSTRRNKECTVEEQHPLQIASRCTSSKREVVHLDGIIEIGVNNNARHTKKRRSKFSDESKKKSQKLVTRDVVVLFDNSDDEIEVLNKPKNTKKAEVVDLT